MSAPLRTATPTKRRIARIVRCDLTGLIFLHLPNAKLSCERITTKGRQAKQGATARQTARQLIVRLIDIITHPEACGKAIMRVHTSRSFLNQELG